MERPRSSVERSKPLLSSWARLVRLRLLVTSPSGRMSVSEQPHDRIWKPILGRFLGLVTRSHAWCQWELRLSVELY